MLRRQAAFETQRVISVITHCFFLKRPTYISKCFREQIPSEERACYVAFQPGLVPSSRNPQLIPRLLPSHQES